MNQLFTQHASPPYTQAHFICNISILSQVPPRLHPRYRDALRNPSEQGLLQLRLRVQRWVASCSRSATTA